MRLSQLDEAMCLKEQLERVEEQIDQAEKGCWTLKFGEDKFSELSDDSVLNKPIANALRRERRRLLKDLQEIGVYA